VGYGLGIDVGTTFTAAAMVRDGAVEVVPLATYQVAVPSVLFAEGDEMLFAGAAERRGASQPLGLAREFKRRLGDSVPLMLSGSPYHADRLTALMARWVVDAVSEQIGEPPTQIAMAHPANWTEYQLGVLRNALVDVGLGDTALVSEPAAAALDFAAVAHLEPGASVLVYDLGGGTFDVALLRRTGDSFEHEVDPVGIERLGGIDFDEAVFQYVVSTVPREALAEARQHPEGAAAIAQLRRRCVDAKEALSSDATADVPVMLPGYTATVRITRPEFEAMIRPMLLQTIDLVRTTLQRANMTPESLGAVLLVGGSSRIPVVPQMVAEQLGLPVRVDAHPKLVVAKGAARRAALSPPTAKVGKGARPARRTKPPAAGGTSRAKFAVLGVAGVAAVAAVAWFALGGDDDPSAVPGDSTAGASTDVTDPATTEESASSTAPASTTPSTSPATSAPVTTVSQQAFVPFAATSEFPTLPQPIDVELVGTDLWVMSQVDGALQRFDTTQAIPEPVETVELGFTGDQGRNGSDVIATDGGLYVTQFDNEAVAFVDVSASPPVVTSLQVPGRPLNGAVLDGTVWVTLQPLEASTTPMAVLPIRGTEVGEPVELPQMPYGIAAIDGELWITFDDDDRIGHFDPTGDVESMTYIDGLEQPIDMLAVDDQVWVTLRDRDQLAVIRREDGVIRHYVETGVQPFKLVSALGSVWVTNNGNGDPQGEPGSVSRLGPVNRSPQQPVIEAGFAPLEIAAGPDRIFVANFGDATISILTPAVLITDSTFSAARAAPGATVFVRNTDTVAHTLTANDGSFGTGVIEPGATGSFTAPDAAGTYDFSCEIHPQMTGTLVVE
jgi:molecular chaperone DnaK